MSRSTVATTDPLRGEIDASRARLVEAADEARRRLERDLHDGAQQRFVLATVWLKRAAARARGTPAEPLVDEAFQQLQQGLAELRDLARGIHPTVLSERGLAAALTGLAARSPLPVELRVTTQRATPSVEAAIYFTVAEALTNVGKHAHATRASVTIDIAERTITAEIADDGIGGAGTTEAPAYAASPTDSTPSAAPCRSTAHRVAPPRSAHKPRCRHIPELTRRTIPAAVPC